MPRLLPLLSVVLLLAMAGCTVPPRTEAQAPARIVQALDAEWRFLQSDISGPENPAFDDRHWRTVNVPHDWSIEGPFDRQAPTEGSGGFLPSGVAWYRKSFPVPAAAAGRRVFVEFDGVMQNSDVWINGAHLGHRPNGYVSFRYELTPHLKPGGAANVLVVRADTAKQPASRWYSGAGIYRHVRLVVTDDVHLEPWATFISTKDVVPAGAGNAASSRAALQFETRVVNQGADARDVAVDLEIQDATGRRVAGEPLGSHRIPAGGAQSFARAITVENPKLWDTTAPHLHRAIVRVRGGARILDQETVTFGIRSAHFDAARGFMLNGRNVRLHGVCLHHDGGAFGAAVPLAVWEQRLAALRQLGANAIRTAHNPPDPGFLDLCDREGWLVMDELFDCWLRSKRAFDYHLFFKEWAHTDVRDTVRRDRNHPSVILYSAGNEIHDTREPEQAKETLRGLLDAFHANDPTRPVTQALFRPNVSGDFKNGLADMLDVIGTNYRDQELVDAWRQKPSRKIIGTEQRHDRETWLVMRDNPCEAGQFLWTGVDYLGESRAWPTIGYGSGLLDRTGTVRPLGRERQSWWTAEPMVTVVRRIAPEEISLYDPGYEPTAAAAHRRQLTFTDWSPQNREPHPELVEVYSNCETVELFLNGASLGSKPINRDAAPRAWRVTFAPGTLHAIGRNDGKEVARHELRTAGAPSRLAVRPGAKSVSPDWEDVVRVAVTILDADGIPAPAAVNDITFELSGPGEIVAIDNGDNNSSELFRGPKRRAYQGRCFAWIRATAPSGTITVRANAANLEPGEATVEAVATKAGRDSWARREPPPP